MRKLTTLLIAMLLVSSSSLWGQTTSITISAQVSNWTSTGVTITPEMAITIEATGEWCGAPWSCYGPEGTGGIAPSAFLAPGLSSGGLVGKVGNNAPFLVGSTCSFNGQDHGTGTLYLAFNDDVTGYYNNSGTMDVTITTTEEGGIELVGQYTTKPAYDLKVRGDYAYVTGLNTKQMYILDISDPANPTLAGTYTSTAAEVREVALIGNYAYIACSWAGFEVIDISDPSSPTKVDSTHSGSGVAVAFEFANGYGFLANRESGIRVFDVSDPANPVHVTTYSTSASNAWASSITVNGNYLYVGIEHSPYGMEVFDISNPAVQNKVATISGTNSVYSIAKDGNYVYHSGQWENTFNVVDVSDPSDPVRVGSGFPTHGDPWGIAVSGNLAFLGERSYGLQILDISNPASPTLLDEYDTGGDPLWGIAVVGDYVYLADGPSGVKIFTFGSSSGAPDSLIIPSVAVQPCDFDECLVQPIQTSLSSPMKGVAIPIGYGPEVTICSLSTAGLVTENWFRPIEEITDSAFFISLADQSGEVIDTGFTTVLNVFYQVDNPDCSLDYVIRWDTTYMADPFRHLAFTDTLFATVDPGFDVGRDSSTVLGYVPGDADWNFVGPDIGDLVYLVNYMFNDGPDVCELHVDVTGNCSFDISDLVKLVNYMFNGGPALECGCSDPNNEVPKLVPSDLVDLTVSHSGNATTVVINSDLDLLGIQLELVGTGTGEPVSALEDGIELIAGREGGRIKVGILDMEGAHAIDAGENLLFTIDGEWEIVSALAADRSFNTIVPTIGAKAETVVPTTFALDQNYPNPFNPTTDISFSLPKASEVTLDIYNTLGQRVETLVSDHLEAGQHTVTWDASRVSSGIYFYRLTTGAFAETKKMVLLK